MDFLLQVQNGDELELKQVNGAENLKKVLVDCAGSDNPLLVKALGGFEDNDLDMIQLFNKLGTFAPASCEIKNVWVIKKHIFGAN